MFAPMKQFRVSLWTVRLSLGLAPAPPTLRLGKQWATELKSSGVVNVTELLHVVPKYISSHFVLYWLTFTARQLALQSLGGVAAHHVRWSWALHQLSVDVNKERDGFPWCFSTIWLLLIWISQLTSKIRASKHKLASMSTVSVSHSV